MKPQKCQCHAVASAADDDNCPVEYDESLNEYNIVSLDGRHRFRLYFCWFCGGELPESKRKTLFTTPQAKEVADIKRSLDDVRTTADAVQRLGPPDVDHQTNESAAEPGFRRQLVYSSRWHSLVLTIRENTDGSVSFAYTGKHKAQANGSRPATNTRKALPVKHVAKRRTGKSR
jgi:hypothetical protein